MMFNPYQQTLMNARLAQMAEQDPAARAEIERFKRAEEAKARQLAEMAASNIPLPPQPDPREESDRARLARVEQTIRANNPLDMSPLTKPEQYVPQPTTTQRLNDLENQRNLERYRVIDRETEPFARRQLAVETNALTPAQQAIVRPPAAPRPAARPPQIQDPTQLTAIRQGITAAQQTPPAQADPLPVTAAAAPASSSAVDRAGGTGLWNPYQETLTRASEAAKQQRGQAVPATIDKGPSTQVELKKVQPAAPAQPAVQNPAVTQPEMGQAQSAPEAQEQGNVPSIEKVNQMSWDNAVHRAARGDQEAARRINQQAIDGMDSQPNFMEKAQSWLDELGQYFTPGKAGEDPNAIHPGYGVPNAQVWEAQRGVLFNAGVLLMAAGMPNTPQGRAQIIAAMGPALNQVGDNLLKTASLQRAGRGKTPTDLQIYEQYQSDPEFRKYWDKYKMGQTDRFMIQERYKLWTNAKEGGYQEAQLARETLDYAKQMNDLVQAGIFTGSFAEQRRNAANFLTTFLPNLTDEDIKQAVANDDVFRGLVMEQVLPRMQELGGNDSEQELAELKRMIARPDTPKRAIEMKLKQIMEKQVMRYNRLRTIGDMSTPEGDPYRLPELQFEMPAQSQTQTQPQPETGGGAEAPAPTTVKRPTVRRVIEPGSR